MAIKPTKTDAKKIHDLLDQEWEDVESMSLAIMERCFEVYAAKAKFAVVGQTRRADNPTFKGVPQNGLCLDVFSTETQATNEALKLTSSTANPTEPHEVWVLPIFHGSAHAYHSERKKQRQAAEQGVTPADRLSALIRSRESVRRCRHAELDDELEFQRCVHYDHHPYDHHLSTEGLPRCDRQVAVPGDIHRMEPCTLHQYHYGTCVAQVHFPEEETHD